MNPQPKKSNSEYWIFSNEGKKTYSAVKKMAVLFAVIIMGVIIFFVFGTDRGATCLQKVSVPGKMLCLVTYSWFWVVMIPIIIASYFLKPFDHTSAPTPPEWVKKIKKK